MDQTQIIVLFVDFVFFSLLFGFLSYNLGEKTGLNTYLILFLTTIFQPFAIKFQSYPIMIGHLSGTFTPQITFTFIAMLAYLALGDNKNRLGVLCFFLNSLLLGALVLLLLL